jgi:hypothetical protein
MQHRDGLLQRVERANLVGREAANQAGAVAEQAG